MHRPLKTSLLACVSVLALTNVIAASPALADVTISTTGTTTDATVITGLVNYTADGTLAMTRATGGSNITSVTTSANNTGTLTLSNTSSHNSFGPIGSSGYALASLQITGGGDEEVNGDLYATAITVSGTSELFVSGNITSTTISLAMDSGISMWASNTSIAGALTGAGYVTIYNTGITLSGQIGISQANRFGSINIQNTGTTTVSDIALSYQIYFSQNGTINLTKATGGSNITAVTTTANNTGTLTLNNTSNTNTFGTIGDSTHYLANLNATGSGGMTDVTGALYATNVTVNSGAILTVSGAITASAVTINGSGAMVAHDALNASTITFTGSNAGVLYVDKTGTTFASDIVTTGCVSGGCGYIEVLGANNTFSGKIGNSASERLFGFYIDNTGTTTLSDTLNAYKTTFWFNGTLNLTNATGGSNINIVDVSTSDNGTITSANTSGTNTFGTIGDSTHVIHAVNLTGSGGTTAVTGNMYVTTTSISNGATLNSFGNITGNLDISSGGVWTVGASGTTLTGTLAINTGTINLGTHTLTVVGNITGTAATVTTTVGTSSVGHIVNTSNTTNATFLPPLTITPTIANGVSVANGAKIVLIEENNGIATVDPSSIATINSVGGYHWTASMGGTGTDLYGHSFGAGALVLTASRGVTVTPGVKPLQQGVVSSLGDYAGANTHVLLLQTAAENLTTAEDINKAGAQLGPQANDVRRTATFDSVSSALSTIATRSDTLRSTEIAKRGFASGEALDGYGFWTQGFGSLANASARGGVDGYDAVTGGAAFGGDARVADDIRLGAMFSYAHTSADQKGDLDGSSLGINSYIGSIYGTYTGAPWYIDGNMSFGIHNYTNKRVVNFSGVSSQTATGSFSGRQYGVGGEFGYPMQVASDVIVTPIATLAYNFLDMDGYTETGSAGAAQTVGAKSTSSLRSGLGAKIANPTTTADGWSFAPNLHATWLHEFRGNAPSLTSSFAGGTPFVTPGLKLAREAGVIGIGADLKTDDNLTLTAKYDLELREQYVGNSLMLQLRKDF